jgi:hypothetical protein
MQSMLKKPYAWQTPYGELSSLTGRPNSSLKNRLNRPFCTSTALPAPRPVPWDELDEFLHQEMVTRLRSSQQFLSAETFHEQCACTCDILRNHHHPAVPYSLIARIFGITIPTLHGHYKNFLSVFGITTRLIARVNRMEAVSIQTDHVTKLVCAFMSAATHVNVMKTFKRAGIGVVIDDGVLRCRVCQDIRQLLLMPLIVAVPDDDDELEAEFYREQCTSLLFDDGDPGE